MPYDDQGNWQDEGGGAANAGLNQAVQQQDPYGAFSAAMTSAYQNSLGRTPSAAEIQSHASNPYGNFNNPGWTQQQTQFIAGSPEAAAYSASLLNKPTPTSTPDGTKTVVQQAAQPQQASAANGSPWGFNLTQLPPAPGAYQYTQGAIPQTAMSTYTPGQISQYSGTSEVYTPQVIQALKAQAQDAGAAQQAAQVQAARQSAATRNTAMGGTLGATEANIGSQSAGQLGQQYGNIDINAALQNWQSQLASYNAQLTGQQAQSQQNYQGYQSQTQAQQFALESAIAQEQAKQAAAASAMQQYGLETGADMGMNSLMNQMVMGRGQMGLDYSKLSLANQLAGLAAGGAQ